MAQKDAHLTLRDKHSKHFRRSLALMRILNLIFHSKQTKQKTRHHCIKPSIFHKTTDYALDRNILLLRIHFHSIVRM